MLNQMFRQLLSVPLLEDLHVHSSSVSFMFSIHGALDDLRSQVAWCPTNLCITDKSKEKLSVSLNAKLIFGYMALGQWFPKRGRDIEFFQGRRHSKAREFNLIFVPVLLL